MSILSGPAYNYQLIKANLMGQWYGVDDFFVLPYYTKRSGKNNEISQFVLDFKNGDPAAVILASRIVVEALQPWESMLRDQYNLRAIVAAPPSSRGVARAPSEAVCRAIAARFTWLKHIQGALERVEAVKKSAWCPPGERPTYDDHVRTIKYVGPKILNAAGKGIILFDDVLTRGETSSACRDIIKNATRCSRVTGVFLARTQ